MATTRDTAGVYTIHATKKVFDRTRTQVAEPCREPSTALGNWYATALFWKPQVALFVNESTLLSVLVPLAPAATVADRLPGQLGRVLDALNLPAEFVRREIASMDSSAFAKTANRSVLGSMNDFAFLAEHARGHDKAEDLIELSVWLAGTPCRPLRSGNGFPDQAVAAVAARVLAS